MAIKKIFLFFCCIISAVLGVVLFQKLTTNPVEKYALLVGADEPYGVRKVVDAVFTTEPQLLAQSLEKNVDVPKENIVVITNKTRLKPTKVEIIAQLENLKSKVDANDEIFLYFLAHGNRYKGKDYFFPLHNNSKSSKWKNFNWKTAISHEEISRIVNSMKAKSALTIYEKCRTSVDEKEKDYRLPLKDLLQHHRKNLLAEQARFPVVKNSQGKLRVTLFSCYPNQFSLMRSKGSRGVFSELLQKGLSGCSADQNGKISLGSLEAFLQPAVFGYVRNRRRYFQIPYLNVEMGTLSQAKNWILSTKKINSKKDGCFLLDSSTKKSYQQEMQKAYKLLLDGQDKQAIKFLENAAKIEPKKRRPWQELIDIGTSLKDWPLVERAYRQLLKQRPKSGFYYENLAYAVQAQGRFEEATKFYLQAEKFRAPTYSIYYSLGRLAVRKKQYKTTVCYCKKAIKLAPNNAEAHMLFAIARSRQRQYDEAEKLFRKSVSLAPTKDYYLYTLAWFLNEKRNKKQEAITLLRRCVKMQPKQVTYRKELTRMLKAQRTKGKTKP